MTLKTPIKPPVKKWLLSVSPHTNENARYSCLLWQLQGSFRLKGDGKEIIGHINILWNPMLCCRAALTFSHLVLYLCKRHCMKCVCVYSFKWKPSEKEREKKKYIMVVVDRVEDEKELDIVLHHPVCLMYGPPIGAWEEASTIPPPPPSYNTEK